MLNKIKGGGNTSPFFHSKYFYWGLLGLGLLLGYLQKTPCFSGSWGSPESVQYRYLCYSDIQALYGFRGLDQKKIPYVQQNPFEYPPLIGYQMYLSALFSNSHVSFFKANAIFNLLWAILAFFALVGIVGYKKELLWFLFAPPFIFHLQINWDISSVACLALAIYFWKKQKVLPTGLALGLGFTGKMFPIFALPFLVLEIWKKNEEAKKQFIKLSSGVLLGILTTNLPTIILDLILNGKINAILGVFGFHAGRTPDFGTFWYWLGEYTGHDPTSKPYTHFVDTCFIFGMAGMLFYTASKVWKNKLGVWEATATMIAICLLLSKVHSLQYSLWLLPIFVIIGRARKSKIFYFFSDFLVFVFGFWWYGNFSTSEALACKSVFITGVVLRAFALLLMAKSYAKK